VLAGTSSQELEDFVGAEFCCLHALADSNQCIWIREKMLEFASTVLSTLSPYLKVKQSIRRGNKTMLTMVQCNCCLFSSQRYSNKQTNKPTNQPTENPKNKESVNNSTTQVKY